MASAFENGTKVVEEYCGSCYGAGDEGECCNTCEDVRNAYRKKGWSFEQAVASDEGIAQCVRDGYIDDLNEQSQNKEGCNLHGTIQVQKVAGNFHFGVGRNFQQAQMHVHDLMPLRNININLTHTINHLSFGTDYPGRKNPLDELERLQTHRTSMYQYFLKVVPTIYEYLGKEEIVNTNQYSVTDYKRDLEGGWDERGKLPGVFFFYDVSPIMVHYKESHTPLYHFITEICAIVGGAVTVRACHSARVLSTTPVYDYVAVLSFPAARDRNLLTLVTHLFIQHDRRGCRSAGHRNDRFVHLPVPQCDHEKATAGQAWVEALELLVCRRSGSRGPAGLDPQVLVG